MLENYIHDKVTGHTKLKAYGRLIAKSILGAMLMVSSSVFAQNGNAVFVIGPDGFFIMLESGGQGAPAPIVLNSDGQVLEAGNMDCGRTPNHPQCQTLHYLQGVTLDKQEQAPGEIRIGLGMPTAGIRPTVFLTYAAPADYPPPFVTINGQAVNR